MKTIKLAIALFCMVWTMGLIGQATKGPVTASKEQYQSIDLAVKDYTIAQMAVTQASQNLQVAGANINTAAMAVRKELKVPDDWTYDQASHVFTPPAPKPDAPKVEPAKK